MLYITIVSYEYLYIYVYVYIDIICKIKYLNFIISEYIIYTIYITIVICI